MSGGQPGTRSTKLAYETSPATVMLPVIRNQPQTLLRVLTLLLLLPLILPAAATSQAIPVDYGVRPGDKVTVLLYTGAGVEVGGVGGERIIDRGGQIFLPYVGPTSVAGLDQAGIRELLTERYATFYQGHVVSVKVELSVSVTGAVRNAGKFFVSPTSSVIDAIASAGGMVSELTAGGGTGIPADQTRVRLVRDGQTTVLNLRPDDISPEVLLLPAQSGDWIHVPNQARSRVRDEIQFWGSIMSFVASVAAVIVLIGR